MNIKFYNDFQNINISEEKMISESKSVPSSPADCIRCKKCQKKLRLSQQFQCKCGDFFCSIHKYADVHSCTFDYKKEWRDSLDVKNPKVDGKKLDKI